MNKQYYQAIEDVLTDGIESSPRGMKIKELFAYRIELDDPRARMSTLKPLQTFGYAKKELEWYLMGTNHISDLADKYRHIWHPFSDDGGKTVNSAYGYRIFGGHNNVGINQWQWVIRKLQEDPDTRQAIININASFDKFNPTKDFPCCVGSQYLLRDGKLNNVVTFRSNDLNLGVKNDIYTFSALQELMAYQLGAKLGKFVLVSNSLHLYEKDWFGAAKVLNNYSKNKLEDVVDKLDVEMLHEKYKHNLGAKVK